MYPTVPSSPPVKVTATAVSSTTILVDWDMVPSIDQNGIITMYEVQFSPLQNFGGAIETNTTIVSSESELSELSVFLNDLQEYVNYAISVRAFTIVGPSNYSDVEIEQTLQDGTAIYHSYCALYADISSLIFIFSSA